MKNKRNFDKNLIQNDRDTGRNQPFSKIKSTHTVMDSELISALLTLAEWEELERIIEAVASRLNLEADLSISDSD